MAKSKKNQKNITFIVLIVLGVIAFSQGGFFQGSVFGGTEQGLKDTYCEANPGANIYHCPDLDLGGGNHYCMDTASTCENDLRDLFAQCNLAGSCDDAPCNNYLYECNDEDITLRKCGTEMGEVANCDPGRVCETEGETVDTSSERTEVYLEDYFCVGAAGDCSYEPTLGNIVYMDLGERVCSVGGNKIGQCLTSGFAPFFDNSNPAFTCVDGSSCTPMEVGTAANIICVTDCPNGQTQQGLCLVNIGEDCVSDAQCPFSAFCNDNDKCELSECSVNSDCNDNNICTQDVCINQVACDFIPANDGAVCGTDMSCAGGECIDVPGQDDICCQWKIVPSEIDWMSTDDCTCEGGSVINSQVCINIGDTANDYPGCSCIDTSWSPSIATVCEGTSFTQTSNCGTTRSATGTKDCGGGGNGCTPLFTECTAWSNATLSCGTRTCSDANSCAGSVDRTETETCEEGESQCAPWESCKKGKDCTVNEKNCELNMALIMLIVGAIGLLVWSKSQR